MNYYCRGHCSSVLNWVISVWLLSAHSNRFFFEPSREIYCQANSQTLQTSSYTFISDDRRQDDHWKGRTPHLTTFSTSQTWILEPYFFRLMTTKSIIQQNKLFENWKWFWYENHRSMQSQCIGSTESWVILNSLFWIWSYPQIRTKLRSLIFFDDGIKLKIPPETTPLPHL